ncbi:MAG: exodeoxyribonuclease VII small subunit [Bacillota bacterium]|nr:exodeoxyribonuclease VII small subunit [Bacillota bacterium]
MAEKRTFESSMKRIEEIVGLLEKGDAPLETSLALYEEAVKLMKECSVTLTRMEQKVTILSLGDETGMTEKPYDTCEDI